MVQERTLRHARVAVDVLGWDLPFITPECVDGGPRDLAPPRQSSVGQLLIYPLGRASTCKADSGAPSKRTRLPKH